MKKIRPSNPSNMFPILACISNLFKWVKNAPVQKVCVPRKMRALVALCVLVCTLLCCHLACADSDIIARVGDVDVKVDDIRPILEKLDPKDQAALAKDPNLLKQTVRSYLAQKLVLKEALAKQWDQQSSFQAEFQRLRDQAVAESYMQSVSKPADSYPSETELKDAYDSNKTSLLVPRQFRLAQILVAPTKGADPISDKTRLDSIRKSLLQPGADFAKIARTQSDDKQSAAQGGEIGWLGENQLQPEVITQVSSLAKGAISDPVRLADGWHIFARLDVKESYTPTLEEVHSQLREYLRVQKSRENRQVYLAKLMTQNQVAINEIALSKVLDATPAKK